MISDITELKRQKRNWTRQTENSNQEKVAKFLCRRRDSQIGARNVNSPTSCKGLQKNKIDEIPAQIIEWAWNVKFMQKMTTADSAEMNSRPGRSFSQASFRDQSTFLQLGENQ